jgi:hypothetical protein
VRLREWPFLTVGEQVDKLALSDEAQLMAGKALEVVIVAVEADDSPA